MSSLIGGLISLAALLIGVVFALTLYFVPSIAAFKRRMPNRFAIFLLNLFFGWTVIGWFVALIWASVAVQHEVG